jgi:hypothetical protein
MRQGPARARPSTEHPHDRGGTQTTWVSETLMAERQGDGQPWLPWQQGRTIPTKPFQQRHQTAASLQQLVLQSSDCTAQVAKLRQLGRTPASRSIGPGTDAVG